MPVILILPRLFGEQDLSAKDLVYLGFAKFETCRWSIVHNHAKSGFLINLAPPPDGLIHGADLTVHLPILFS